MMNPSGDRLLVLFLVIFALLRAEAQAQSAASVGSIRQALASARTDSARVNLLGQLARRYLRTNPDSSIFYAQKILSIGTATVSSYAIATGHQFLGVAFETKAEYDTALVHFMKALHQVEEMGDRHKAAYVKNSIAIVYRKNGDIENAIAFYEEAMASLRTIGDEPAVAMLANNLGNLYAKRSDFETARVYYDKAVALREKLGDEKGLAQTYMGIGFIRAELGQYERAEAAYQRALSFFQNTKDKISLAQALGHLGDLYRKQEQYERARDFYLQSLRVSRDAQHRESALANLERLVTLDSLRGDYRSALNWNAEHRLLRDSLFSESKNRQIEALKAAYESEKQARQIQALQQQTAIQELRNEQQRLWLLIGGIVIVLLLVAAFFLYRLYTIKRDSNRKIQTQNQLIRQALEDKETLMQEMHHRTKNNLNILQSLLHTQTRHLKDSGARHAIRESQSRMHVIGMIHQYLYSSEGKATINVKDYLEALGERLSASILPSNIRLSMRIDNAGMDIHRIVPLALFINEGITNAAKHAFPGGQAGRICITLTKADGHFHLQIADDGIGFPGDQPLHDPGAFKLLKGLSRQLQGDLEMKDQRGLLVALTFPAVKSVAGAA